MRRALVALALVAGAATAVAEGQIFRGQMIIRGPVLPNPKYDGQFTFVRLRYGPPTRYVSQGLPWSHDYPIGERNFMKILDEVSYLGPKTEESIIFGLDDPELFKHPVSYMSEPGFWVPTQAEAAAFRAYLLKGGFVIFDDFEGPDHWDNMVRQMKRALPDHDFVKIDESHPIFHSFYNINKIHVPHPSMSVTPGYYAMYENNDPTRRMIALANHNSDIAEYWEWSAEGLYNPDPTSNAYRLGVNYYVYAMTH
jgi:hypothetical protein